jgi:hypothetical protein
VLGSLVAQLCAQTGRFPPELESQFDRSNCSSAGQRRRPNFTVFRDVLQSLSEDNRLVLLIDALDECDNRDQVLEFISVIQAAVHNISILITSRDEPDIRATLRKDPFVHIRLENRSEEMDRDIQSYLDSRLKTAPNLQRLPSAVKIDIAQSVNAKSAGM